jgi:hypothetical protein
MSQTRHNLDRHLTHREKRINGKSMPQNWTISITMLFDELCMNFMKKAGADWPTGNSGVFPMDWTSGLL